MSASGRLFPWNANLRARASLIKAAKHTHTHTHARTESRTYVHTGHNGPACKRTYTLKPRQGSNPFPPVARLGSQFPALIRVIETGPLETAELLNGCTLTHQKERFIQVLKCVCTFYSLNLLLLPLLCVLVSLFAEGKQ